MKFKEFLNLYERTYDVLDLASDFYMPLFTDILSQFERDVKITFRVDKLNNLPRLIKNRNKTQQLPTFTRGSEGLGQGAWNRPEILVELSGKTVFKSPADLTSYIDNNKKRWIDPNNAYESQVAEKFVTYMKNYMYSYLIRTEFGDYLDDVQPSGVMTGGKPITKRFFVDKGENDFPKITVLKEYLKNASENFKRQYIKKYYEVAKDFFIKNPKYVKQLEQELENRLGTSDYDNDEILLHHYKIKKVWLIEDILVDLFFRNYNEIKEMYKNSKYKSPLDFLKENYPKELKQFIKNLEKLYKTKFCDTILSKDDIVYLDLSKRLIPNCKR